MNELILRDPTVVAQSFLDKWLASLVNDRRDVRVLRMALLTFLIMVSSTVLVFVHFAWWTALLHMALFIVLMGPHTITLHLMSHRRFFKQKVAWLDYPLLHGLGMLFGHTPRSYFSHHIGMHHVEGGLDPDASCTHHFQRDSIGGFLQYVGRFLFMGFVDLNKYLAMKNMRKLRRELILGDVTYWLIVLVLAIINWQATLAVFIFSLLYTRSIMMAGNWGQHSLVDPQAPDDVYRNTVTCVNAFYNTWCYNDGYHVSHHFYPTMHWTEHPKSMLKNIEKYVEHDAIVFHTIDFFGVWFLLMLKQHRKLASYYVQLTDTPRTEKEIVALIKSRLLPVPKSA
jgi:fatty acid desaturase